MPGQVPKIRLKPTRWCGQDARLWPPLMATIIALTVYAVTVAPELTFAHHGTDGGDLITAARTLGIPHPPGYPTYTLLAWLFTRLPAGSIAYRVHLLSAASAALAVGLLCRTVQVLLPDEESPGALSVATALTAAFAPLLWSQAVIAEVYALLTLLAALLFHLWVHWRQGGPDSTLWLSALLLALGLGVHLTLIASIPAALILLWPRRHRLRQPGVWLPCLGCLLLGMSVYVYLPLAATHQPPLNWGDPRTWDRFLWVVTARPYQNLVFGLPWAEVPRRMATWAALLTEQFGWWGLILALAGFLGWWQQDRFLALSLLAWAFLIGTYSFFYHAPDSYVYLLPTLLWWALGWSEGARRLLDLARRLAPAARSLTLVGILVLPFLSLGIHWGSIDLSDEHETSTYLTGVLNRLEPNALVITRGDAPTFALWYGLYAEGQRPDVAVVNAPLLVYPWYRAQIRRLYPDLNVVEPANDWTTPNSPIKDLIAGALPTRPVYATDPDAAWQAQFSFILTDSAPLYRVLPKGESR